jgi:DNA-binding transcriptional LysR family regulator
VRDVPQCELRLGLFGGLAGRVLPALMQRLAVAAPTARVLPVDSAGDRALFAQLEDGRLDVAFVERPLVGAAFDAQELQEDPWVLLVQAESPLARTPVPPTLEELGRLPLIGVTGSRSQARVLHWMGELGLRPRVVAYAESELTARSFVRAGLGVAIVPRLTAAAGDQVVAVELRATIPPRTLALCWLRQRRHLPGLDELCTIVAAVTRELVLPDRAAALAA